MQGEKICKGLINSIKNVGTENSCVDLHLYLYVSAARDTAAVMEGDRVLTINRQDTNISLCL